MDKRTRHGEKGFTLLELTIGIALFLIILGVVAQGLISYYVVMDAQHQRTAAAQILRGVLADMRVVRDANPDAFPGAVCEAYPDGSNVTGPGLLPNEAIVVTYADDSANPLEVTLTLNWTDLRGRPVQETMATLLTDR
ncbi:MAG: type II secretion system protein [Candidatus Hydrogenedentota bacterium]